MQNLAFLLFSNYLLYFSPQDDVFIYNRPEVFKKLAFWRFQRCLVLKSSQYLNVPLLFFVDSFLTILAKWYRYQFVEEVLSNILSTKEVIKRVTLGIPKEMKKIQFPFLLLLDLIFWSEMKIWFPRNTKQTTVWHDPASIVSYQPSKLEGWSKIEQSLVRVWPWHNFYNVVNHPTLRACITLCIRDYFEWCFALCS